jgi:hypothetical protein
MNAKLLQPALRFLGSGPGLGLILIIALCATVLRLSSLKAQSNDLQEVVATKREDFSRNIATAAGSTNMKFAKNKLGQWQQMAEDEAQRIEALSSNALAAGVTIVSLRSRDSVTIEGGEIIQLSHEIEGVGEQRQIAQFLESIYHAEGLASIDSLLIEPEEEENPEMLVAYLKVTWFAPVAAAEVTP